MYAHEIDHRTTGVAFGNRTLGGMPTAASVRPDGSSDECPGAVPGEPTARADQAPGAASTATTPDGGIVHV